MATQRVRATIKGYYGDEIREEGEEFDIPADEKPGSWMEVLSAPKKAAPKKAAPKKADIEDDNPFGDDE